MALPPNPGEGPQLHEVRLTWLAWDASAFWCGAGKRSELVSCVCAVALSCTRQSQHKQGTAMASIHMHRRILRTALAFGAAALLVSALLFAASPEIGRAHGCTPVTNAHLVCRLRLSKKNTQRK